jgi:uncharacterized protein YndB with AHSA1/START domain
MTDALYEQQVRILARPDAVFDLLVDSDQMARWFGQGNDLVAEPGGALRVDINGRDIAAGRFVTIERPTRVVFTWGWENSADMPPGSSTVEITLQPDGDDTLLTLAGSTHPRVRALQFDALARRGQLPDTAIADPHHR